MTVASHHDHETAAIDGHKAYSDYDLLFLGNNSLYVVFLLTAACRLALPV